MSENNHQGSSTHSFFDSVIVFSENTLKGAKAAHKTIKAENKLLQAYTAHQAFREYDWLRQVPRVNKAGNLRGMIVNAEMRKVYTVTLQNAEHLKIASKLFRVAAIGIELAKDSDKIKNTLNSNESSLIKGEKIVAITTLAVTRGITGIIPDAVHVLAKALSFSSHHGYIPMEWSNQFGKLDTTVSVAYTKITSSDNALHFIDIQLAHNP